MSFGLLVLHGPDLVRLGRGRLSGEPSLDALDATLDLCVVTAGGALRAARGEEADLVRALDAAVGWATHVLVSPGALAPTAWVLRAALAFHGLPYAEVFVAGAPGSDDHRQRSVLEAAAAVRRRGSASTVYADVAEKLLGVSFTTSAALATPASAPLPAPKVPLPPRSRPPAAETLPPPVATQPPGILASAVEAGVVPRKTSLEVPAAATKTLGRKVPPPPPRSGKTIGRRETQPDQDAPRHVTRAHVRQHLSDRLSGRISAAELATWGRDQWLTIERGGPTESGQRELLHETLQRLALSSTAGTSLTDPELLDLLARMG